MEEQFHSIASNISDLTDQWESRLRELPDDAITNFRNKQDRSVKQIVGHLVDSTTNNTHRMIHLQYQESPIFYPDYANLGNNDRWIAIQNFQEEEWNLLVDTWAANLRHIAFVIQQVDQEKLGQEWVSALGEKITLKEMIVDFPRHLELHLGEIEELLAVVPGIKIPLKKSRIQDKTGSRVVSLVLLFFLGITALGGSVGLLLDPTGASLKLPPEILEGIPFQSYTVPAILLGLFNGLMSLTFGILVLCRSKYQAWLLIIQGSTLVVWLAAEIVLGLFFAFLTLPYLLIGAGLIICGVLLNGNQRPTGG